MFLVNSRYHYFSATHLCLVREVHHTDRHTFSRSYSANLPSSLTRGLSSALEFSSGPPVSVCGTSAHIIHCRGFSWKLSIGELSRPQAALHCISETRENVCRCRVLSSLPTCLNRQNQSPGSPNFLRPHCSSNTTCTVQEY